MELQFECEDLCDDDEAWLAEVDAIAVRPILAAAWSELNEGGRREGLYGFARAFGCAADQHRRWAATRTMCRWLSNAFDRLWLITAPSPRQQHYSCMVAETAA